MGVVIPDNPPLLTACGRNDPVSVGNILRALVPGVHQFTIIIRQTSGLARGHVLVGIPASVQKQFYGLHANPMTIETGIALDMHGAHVPVLPANDIVRRILVQLRHHGFVCAGDLGRLDERVGYKWISLMTGNTLHWRGDIGPVELLRPVNPWHLAAHAQCSFILRHPVIQISESGFKERRGPGLLVVANHLHRTHKSSLVAIPVFIPAKRNPDDIRQWLALSRPAFIPLKHRS